MSQLTSPLNYVQPDTNQWGVCRLDADKEQFIDDIIERVLAKAREDYPTTKALFDELASTLYQERIRVTTSRWKSDADDEKDFWNNFKGQIIKFQKAQSWENEDRKQLESMLKKILYRYSYEMVANFNPKIFNLMQSSCLGFYFCF